MNQDGEIRAEECLDSDFKAGLQRAAKAELERVLTGEETTKDVQQQGIKDEPILTDWPIEPERRTAIFQDATGPAHRDGVPIYIEYLRAP